MFLDSDCWLVTGGAGFIGSHFVHRVLSNKPDLRLVNLDCLTYAACPLTLDRLKHPNHIHLPIDITNPEAVSKVFNDYRPIKVIHFAAESHVDRSIDSPSAFMRTNVDGTMHVLQAALQLFQEAENSNTFRFLHISTDEVYGSLAGNDPAFTENSQYRPNSPYSASKAAADHLVRAWHKTYGLPTLTSNCSNNYGAYQYPEKLIPLMTLKALAGEKLPVYGDGQQIRDWLHVEDHVSALFDVLERGNPGEVYNIGGDNERSNLDVVKSICRCVDELQPVDQSRLDLIEFVTDRPGHDRRYAINADKIHNELDWSAQTDFDQGLRQTVEWYIQNPEWVAAAHECYQGQRLGMDAGLDTRIGGR